ncbi:MAG: sporulation protein YqfD [Clostridia bacterium]|nr:sporulation protein YqfD [Clostridia bacterium]
MKIELWSYVRGYVIIKIEGLSVEKFLNLAVREDIHIWDVHKLSHIVLTAKATVKDFKRLSNIAQKVKCNISIIEKKGLPFIIYRLKIRKMLAAGAVLFLLILYYLSSFIWDIEIQGIKTVDENYVIDKLNEYGVKIGVKKRSIDTNLLENNLLLNLTEFSWIGIEIRGTKIIVNVVESIEKPEIIDDQVPCDIIAVKDAMVETIVAFNGNAVVQPGDIVKKGDILITGIIELDQERCFYVHSMGEIIGRVWYESDAEQDLQEIKVIRTGNKDERKILKVSDLELIIKERDQDFNKYQKQTNEKKLINSNIFDFPIYIKSEIYYETYEKKEKINIEQAQNIVKDKALQKIMDRIPPNTKIVDKQFSFSIIGKKRIKVKAIIEALENIGNKHPININQEENSIE